MKLTFVDAGVLIAPARGGTDQTAHAMSILSILDDPEREFASSPFLRLEVLPRAVSNRHEPEVAFYEAFFEAVTSSASDLPAIAEAGYREAAI